MESGRKRVRQTATALGESLEVQWNFTADQYALFKTFFDTTLANGSSAFYIEIFGVSKLMAFYDASYVLDHSDNHFAVTATLEYVDAS